MNLWSDGFRRIIGARIYHVLFIPAYYLSSEEIPAIWHGGLRYTAAHRRAYRVVIYLKKRTSCLGMATPRPRDHTGQPSPFRQPMNGRSPRADVHALGMIFARERGLGAVPGIPLHPRAYEMFINLSIFSASFALRKKGRRLRLRHVFSLYSIGSFVVEGFRADSPDRPGQAAQVARPFRLSDPFAKGLGWRAARITHAQSL